MLKAVVGWEGHYYRMRWRHVLARRRLDVMICICDTPVAFSGGEDMSKFLLGAVVAGSILIGWTAQVSAGGASTVLAPTTGAAVLKAETTAAPKKKPYWCYFPGQAAIGPCAN